MNTNTTTREAAATVLSTKLVLSLSAIPLATLVTACSAGTNPSAPVARSDTVAEAVQNYAGDPGERRFTIRTRTPSRRRGRIGSRRSRARGDIGARVQIPREPSRVSRMMSAWPAWRAVSSIMWNRT